jgi:hypothetical protein
LQAVHCWSDPVLQLRPAAQPVIGVHGVQTRSVLLVQAVLSYVPVAQAAVHASQRLGGPATRWVPLAHAVHC